MSDDIGLAAIHSLRDVLGLESDWTVEELRGFSWWGCERKLRAWAEAPVLDREGHGEDTCRLHAELDLLAPGPLTEGIRAVAEDFAEGFPLSAILLHPDGRLTARCCVEVRSKSPELVDLFTQAVALQWACGRAAVDGLADASGRSIQRSHPPGMPERKGPCRLYRWLQVAAEAGKSEGRWTEQAELDEVLALARVHRLPAGVPGEDDPPGHAWAAFPFPQGNEELDPVAPGLVTVEKADTHPWLGRGAWVRLWLPPFVLRTCVGLDVLAINAQDARQDVYPHLLGNWRWVHGGPEGDVRAPVHDVFLPNFLFQPGRLAEVVRALLARGRALANYLAGPPSPHLDGALEPAMAEETLIAKVRSLARSADPGWQESLGGLMEASASSRHFLEAFDAVMAARHAGLFSGAMVYPHVDGEAPYFRWTPHTERHLPDMTENELKGLTLHTPAIPEVRTDLGIHSWKKGTGDGPGPGEAEALGHFEQAAALGCPYGAFNAGCILVTVSGLKSLWRAVPLLRFAAQREVPGAKEALAYLDRWGRFSVRWIGA